MTLILTDIDDTLLFWGKGFIKYASQLGYDITGAETNVSEWIKSNLWIQDNNSIDKFNLCDQFSQLEPYPDAVEVVNRMKANGNNFIAISAVDQDQRSWDLRKQNLDKHFPNVFDAIIHVGFQPHSKKSYLQWFKPTYWVEDSVHHACDGAACGHTTFLLERPYNCNFADPHINNVKSWYDIEEKLNKENR